MKIENLDPNKRQFYFKFCSVIECAYWLEDYFRHILSNEQSDLTKTQRCTGLWDISLFINLFLIVIHVPHKTLPNICALSLLDICNRLKLFGIDKKIHRYIFF